MSRIKHLLIAILMLTLVAFTMVACSGEPTLTVAFDSAGGSTIASQSVVKGEKAVKPEDPTRDGYEFRGWFINDEAWDFIGYAVTENITLVAQWEIIEYNITYNLNGGNNLSSAINTYTVETDVELPIISKDFNLFMGWYNQNDEKVEKITAGTTGDITLTAKWEYCGFTIKSLDNGCSITKADKNVTSLRIPSEYLGKPVTSIGNYTFYGCSSLTSIEIPNSVTSIGNYTFYGCSSLASIEIPNSVTSIGNYAFEECSSLASIEIPSSVTSIGHYAFYDCSSLTSIEIPNSVISIGEDAFRNCSSLTNVTIGDSVTSIGSYAFYGCSSLTSIEIPNSVTSIGNYAFYNCSSLTNVTIGDSVASIRNYAFEGCTSLTSITYAGTKSQWDSISKGGYWANGVRATVFCTDGNISIS